MDDKFFNDIHEEITNAAFGKNGKCFLLIDASLGKVRISHQTQKNAYVSD